jgi:hypothetical protein
MCARFTKRIVAFVPMLLVARLIFVKSSKILFYRPVDGARYRLSYFSVSLQCHLAAVL